MRAIDLSTDTFRRSINFSLIWIITLRRSTMILFLSLFLCIFTPENFYHFEMVIRASLVFFDR